MLKTVYVLRRKQGMTAEEFQRYWREVHGPLVRKYGAILGLRRYVQVHTRLPEGERRTDPLRGNMQEPFDGVAELWFDPAAATGTEEERRAAVRALAEDEAKFIDFTRSAIWRAEEVVMFGEATPV